MVSSAYIAYLSILPDFSRDIRRVSFDWCTYIANGRSPLIVKQHVRCVRTHDKKKGSSCRSQLDLSQNATRKNFFSGHESAKQRFKARPQTRLNQ
eukprot:1136364-Pelagomonas_calceolata.AAC.5